MFVLGSHVSLLAKTSQRPKVPLTLWSSLPPLTNYRHQDMLVLFSVGINPRVSCMVGKQATN